MFASISNRVNTFLLLLLVLMAAAIIAILATRSSAGPLDPTGPPSSTLPLVEPRTPISSLPYTISSPGSYYLTGDLNSSTSGITINSSDVELDLNGFTLTGTASFDGINSGFNQITLRNGRVHGFLIGVGLAGDDNEVDDVAVSNSALNGVTVGDRGVVRRVRAIANGLTGIAADSFNDRISVFDSEADFNGGDGISAREGASRIERNTVNFNAGHGINVTNDNVVIGNSLQSNNASGPAGEHGIFVDGSRNRIEGNSVRVTIAGDGIHVAGDVNYVNNNLVAANGSAGIRVASTGDLNRIEGNYAAGNTSNGISLEGWGNTVFRNSASGNVGVAYFTGAGNDIGPLQLAATATSPWANLYGY